MKPLEFQQEPIRIAKLENGEKVNYDACGNSQHDYPHYEYIGEGIIWTINGVNQNSTTKRHFFKRK